MSLKVFVGCQSSGKTLSNITEATLWLDVLDERGLYINSIIDTRDDVHMISSNSSSYNGVSDKFDIVKVKNLFDVLTMVNLDNYNVVSIDEIQFFQDLEEFVKLLLSKGKHIICSGLDSDWMGQDFGQVKELLKLATSGFTKLSAKCVWCKDRMTERNIRMIPDACRTGKIGGSKSQVESGGKDKYIPLCFEHHKEHLMRIHGMDPDNPVIESKKSLVDETLLDLTAIKQLEERINNIKEHGLYLNNSAYPVEREIDFSIIHQELELMKIIIERNNSEKLTV